MFISCCGDKETRSSREDSSAAVGIVWLYTVYILCSGVLSLQTDSNLFFAHGGIDSCKFSYNQFGQKTAGE